MCVPLSSRNCIFNVPPAAEHIESKTKSQFMFPAVTRASKSSLLLEKRKISRFSFEVHLKLLLDQVVLKLLLEKYLFHKGVEEVSL